MGKDITQGSYHENSRDIAEKLSIIDDSKNIETTGSITAEGGFVGNLSADSEGQLEISGEGVSISGRVCIEESFVIEPASFKNSGDLLERSFCTLSGSSSAVDMTLYTRAGLFTVITCNNATNNCTVTLSSGTFDGTNNKATFDSADETLVLFCVSGTRWVIIENIGSVALSAV